MKTLLIRYGYHSEKNPCEVGYSRKIIKQRTGENVTLVLYAYPQKQPLMYQTGLDGLKYDLIIQRNPCFV